MKIVYLLALKELAVKIGEKIGVICIDSRLRGNDKTNESIIFVGRGLANTALKRKKKYPKCWEVGSKADSFDYLRKIILNEETVDNKNTVDGHRKAPEKKVFMELYFDCGDAAVKTLLLMLQREDVLKTDVFKRLDVNEVDGVKSINIKKLFDEENIPFLEVWNADLSDAEKVLDNGGVMLVSYQAEGTEEEIERLECGHYSIIFDVDSEFVWLIDPSYNEEYTPGLGIGVVKLPRDEFEKLWIDKGIDGTIYEKWMMAVRV
ncbi:MAG: hypothetical protein UX08_C0027G0002 [Candidatus Collierbacteria bacterium GW2011_GWB1_45_35]|uniref:Peptidase C39-like domain-containing protein n=2 Tax=Candidatus Collieribacteriota TaxID=1752725 RepID=A0A0G1MWI3_9BACT|nr:MAG: hypothetical protein UW48_C0022G0005 [Microgenomates group bacterium GW2011_GWC1_44_23]KKT85127.1 MAG: hypothetical protein UW84_C0041G0002 [Candidatus Collierbacteria bacterium GW2011_GWA2_44_99]KKT98946.1 MAG: hypothetical protein UX01_C0016G0003 [Candidatus Collierbacteria bacterium GW2011_GWB2_45_17]KKU04406.1 MAG: hypothetical protein UX08_C0027G0002 [Candidatus Collierbacteria bacterium GW2011_GWB1_45_35]KKU06722.1 MAG: hypothetical protein UX11_C0029G0005 [Candidatus Collierbacte